MTVSSSLSSYTSMRLLFLASSMISSSVAQFASGPKGPFTCNVCKDSPDGQPARTLANPSQSFQMNGDTWTCGYLQETVQDVNPYTGAPGEARWCALAQLWAETPCTCNGPAPLPPPDIKDPNPACDICPSGQYQFDYVPASNAELAADTGVAGNMNCEGLYHAASEGVLTSNLCGEVRANAGPVCCNAQTFDIGSPPGGGGGGVSQPQVVQQPVCAGATGACQQDRDCCPGLKCKTKTITGPKYCASARARTRISIAGSGIGGAAGRARAGQ